MPDEPSRYILTPEEEEDCRLEDLFSSTFDVFLEMRDKMCNHVLDVAGASDDEVEAYIAQLERLSPRPLSEMMVAFCTLLRETGGQRAIRRIHAKMHAVYPEGLPKRAITFREINDLYEKQPRGDS